MLENLSFASLPAIAGTIICGIGLTGLMLWIIERGRTHMQDSNKAFQIYKQVDLLQNERQQRDSERQNGTISAKEHANACHEIDKRLLALTLDMDLQQHEHQSILTPRIIMLSFLVPALSTFIYLFLGSPQSPDQPITGRSAEIAAAKAGAIKDKMKPPQRYKRPSAQLNKLRKMSKHGFCLHRLPVRLMTVKPKFEPCVMLLRLRRANPA